MRLNDFRRNVYSQFGEDGIIERLFDELQVEAGFFCEFGAWDGKRFSNTYLLHEKGWKGVYIEGDSKRFADLKRNVAEDGSVELICAYVRPSGPNSLDQILMHSRLIKQSKRLDLLSIDIDSDDLAIWRSLTVLRPSVVVIEFNPTIPLDTDYVNPPGENKGNAARSIAAFAELNRYDLVATTHCNLVFVDAQVRPVSVERIDLIREGLDEQIRFFWGYDGSLIRATRSRGEEIVEIPELVQVPWKFAFMAQPVPAMFRRYEQSRVIDALGFAYGICGLVFFRPVAAFLMAREIVRLVRGKLRFRRSRVT